MKTSLSRSLLCLFAFALFVTGAVAQDMGALRQRMSARLPQLDQLKAEGIIGETNDGMVALRVTGNAVAARLVAEENEDRKAVYSAIAQRAGTDPKTVGEARARQIAANSAAGVWLQDAAGNWAKKP